MLKKSCALREKSSMFSRCFTCTKQFLSKACKTEIWRHVNPFSSLFHSSITFLIAEQSQQSHIYICIHKHKFYSLFLPTLNFKVNFAVLSPNLLNLLNAFNLAFFFFFSSSTYSLLFCSICIFLRVEAWFIRCFSLKQRDLNTNVAQHEQVLEMSTIIWQYMK